MAAASASDKIDMSAMLESYKSVIDKRIEKWLPKQWDNKQCEFASGKAHYAYDAESITKAVIEPLWEILSRGGKRWRPVLLLLVAEALGHKAEEVEDLVVLCEVVHNGTLVVDDIEDGSQLRRGKPCLHRIYTLDVAVNAGNAMYYLPLLVLRELRGKVPDSTLVRAYELYSAELLNLHFGQGMDIWWHNGHKEPNEQEYLQMCAFKTGTLARLSAKLSALIVGGSDAQIDAIGTFAESIGVAFQIQDDILNIAGEKFQGHESGEDIHEGKKTLMVIYATQKLRKEAPAKEKRLNEILAMHTEEKVLIDEAINILKECGSIQYAQSVARKIITDAWAKLDPVIVESEAKRKLKAFADYLIEREF